MLFSFLQHGNSWNLEHSSSVCISLYDLCPVLLYGEKYNVERPFYYVRMVEGVDLLTPVALVQILHPEICFVFI